MSHHIETAGVRESRIGRCGSVSYQVLGEPDRVGDGDGTEMIGAIVMGRRMFSGGGGHLAGRPGRRRMGRGSVIVVADRYPEVLELDDSPAETLAAYMRGGGRAYARS